MRPKSFWKLRTIFKNNSRVRWAIHIFKRVSQPNENRATSARKYTIFCDETIRFNAIQTIHKNIVFEGFVHFESGVSWIVYSLISVILRNIFIIQANLTCTLFFIISMSFCVSLCILMIFLISAWYYAYNMLKIIEPIVTVMT